MPSTASHPSPSRDTPGDPSGLGLEPLRAAPETLLADGDWTDRQRLGLVLQGAAALCHLEALGARLAGDWSGAGVDGERRLCGLRHRPGRDREVLPQSRLRELLELLLAPDAVGRGSGRRAGRELLRRWRQELAPVPPGRAVRQILRAAPFLWEDGHGVDRRALVAPGKGAEALFLVAGASPEAVTRLREAVGSVEEAGILLEGPDAHRWWMGGSPEEETMDRASAGGQGVGDPEALAAAGRHRAALDAWRRHGVKTPEAALAAARSLLAQGRFLTARDALQGAPPAELDHPSEPWKSLGDDPEGELLTLRCRLYLGELGAVRRRLGRLFERTAAAGDTSSGADALPAALVVELAEVAVRVHGNRHRPEKARDWVARARQRARRARGSDAGLLQAAAELTAAEAAWDRGELEALDDHLERARGLEERAGGDSPSWRWHQVAGLGAMARGDGAGVVDHLSRALGRHRRQLGRHRAGSLWSDLGVGRALLGDLPGAERAFLHAQRLHGGCEGPRQTTLALSNLAEVRLRRGRVRGVEVILERSLRANRASSNLRGIVQDLALWARYELVLGRTDTALEHCREALELLEEQGLDWYRPELQVLRARALGWAGRPRAARRALAEAGDRAQWELEGEELPGLYALAGDGPAARQAARGTPFEELWERLLAGPDREGLPLHLWKPLDRLEPYRAARLLVDVERLHPGVAPPDRRRRAVEVLRRLGGDPFADRLERAGQGVWQALAAWLGEAQGQEANGDELPGPGHPVRLRRLFREMGYPRLRLTWRPEEDAGEIGPGAEPEVLIEALGRADEGRSAKDLAKGPDPEAWERRSVPCPVAGATGEVPGSLVLEAPVIDPCLEAVLTLVAPRVELAAADRVAGEGAVSSPGPGDPLGVDDEADGGHPLIGESPVLRQAVGRTDRLAPTEVPILILGESGTGKELVARRIHRGSPRRRGSFVAVNCAALGETLVLSDLFGHVKGAFTGAEGDRAGVFETGHEGTVFLDEIGDLPASAQGMLLRVLQEGEVRRVGESLPRPVDVRVVAATHRDLAVEVAEGRFRQDLYYRLRGAVVTLPPLRERGRDVLLLAEHLLQGASSAGNGDRAPRLSAKSRQALLAHPWPGNVRHLQQVLTAAVALCDGDRIEPEHLELDGDLAGQRDGQPAASGRVIGSDEPAASYHQQVDDLRRRLVREALEASGGHRAEAARTLGLSRQALSYLTRTLEIDL